MPDRLRLLSIRPGSVARDNDLGHKNCILIRHDRASGSNIRGVEIALTG